MDETPVCHHSNESLWTVLSCYTVCFSISCKMKFEIFFTFDTLGSDRIKVGLFHNSGESASILVEQRQTKCKVQPTDKDNATEDESKDDSKSNHVGMSNERQFYDNLLVSNMGYWPSVRSIWWDVGGDHNHANNEWGQYPTILIEQPHLPTTLRALLHIRPWPNKLVVNNGLILCDQ